MKLQLSKRPLKKSLGRSHMFLNIRLQMPGSGLPVFRRIADAAG
jgi:hypothetical protein